MRYINRLFTYLLTYLKYDVRLWSLISTCDDYAYSADPDEVSTGRRDDRGGRVDWRRVGRRRRRQTDRDSC